MQHEAEYKDWLGQPIEVGSPVLYAISEGHFAKVVWGEVLEIIPLKQPEGKHGVFAFRTFKLKIQPYYENVEVLESSHTGWGGRNVEYDWQSDEDEAYKRRLPNPATIKNVEKVTVFPLPPGVRETFERRIDEGIRQANERRAAYRAK